MSTALLLVDHGSSLAQANELLHSLAVRLGASRTDLIVRAAHMEIAQPDMGTAVADCLAAGASEIVVVPYMLTPGRHATRDIPGRVIELSKEYPKIRFRVSEPLGVHSKIGDIVLDQARV